MICVYHIRVTRNVSWWKLLYIADFGQKIETLLFLWKFTHLEARKLEVIPIMGLAISQFPFNQSNLSLWLARRVTYDIWTFFRLRPPLSSDAVMTNLLLPVVIGCYTLHPSLDSLPVLTKPSSDIHHLSLKQKYSYQFFTKAVLHLLVPGVFSHIIMTPDFSLLVHRNEKPRESKTLPRSCSQHLQLLAFRMPRKAISKSKHGSCTDLYCNILVHIPT